MRTWQFWIDVGGTFTDCIGCSPAGELRTCKVLSSAVTKGRAEAIDGARIVDSTRAGDRDGFWVGYRVRFLDAAGSVLHMDRVTGFEASGSRLMLRGTLPSAVTIGTRYELWSGEDAPILAIRTILGLALADPIPTVTVKLGTTRGTNALLERKGARTAFVTTRGFGDVLLIGNQNRPRLFDLAIRKPQPLFERVVEIDERLDVTGRVLVSPDANRVRDQLRELKHSGVESVAICLLHSFVNPEHEQLVERLAREVGFEEISTSSRLSPLIKIVSRGDTTVMDAYLNPILRRYVGTIRESLAAMRSADERPEPAATTRPHSNLVLESIEETIASAAREQFGDKSTIAVVIDSRTGELHVTVDETILRPEQVRELFGRATVPAAKRRMLEKLRAALAEDPHQQPGDPQSSILDPRQPPSTVNPPPSTLKLMTSAGGLVDADRFVGKDSILSGPAGGVIGFSRVAQRAGFDKSIGFDMGGTSTDVSRFDGTYELEYETEKAGVRVVAPMLAIETVAAGGGSICRFDDVKLAVGPESAGADPGPACYGRGGPLTVTDVNLYLGKILPARFPFPLDRSAVEQRLTALCDEVAASPLGHRYTPVELAEGFVEIANANMVRAIRKISVARGYDPAEYVLVTFGGAGAQHACAMARLLGIRRILIHPFAGILSAYGIGLADVRRFAAHAVLRPYSDQTLAELEPLFERLEAETIAQVQAEGLQPERIRPPIRSLDMRYKGVESTINVRLEPEARGQRAESRGQRPAVGGQTTDHGPRTTDVPSALTPAQRYEELHQQLYGYRHAGRPIEITAARVEVVGAMPDPPEQTVEPVPRVPQPAETVETVFGGRPQATAVFLREHLHPGDQLTGPAIVCEPTSTVVIDPGFAATITTRGELLIEEHCGPGSGVQNSILPAGNPATHCQPGPAKLNSGHPTPDPVLLEIFNNLFASIAEQMGVTLQRTSFSTNVKERLDFSCAIFSPTGDLVVNAPHIPVHLGAMSETVKRVLADNPDMAPGDVFVTNDPYRGGSHLPDVTVVTPVHHDETGELLFFTASRAHHAEIGGIVPGSMPPFSRTLAEEGVLIRNFQLVDREASREDALRELLTSAPWPTRNVHDNLADISAQVAANNSGVRQLGELVEQYTLPVVQAYMQHIQRAAAAKMRLALAALADGDYALTDHLDDGSPIAVRITIRGDRAVVDFTGTGPVLPTNLNANRAIVTAAVLYVFRCLIAEDIPLNSGVLEPVEIVLPECLLNPPERADPSQCPAIVGGNVETSQRVVDTLLGALQLAAASQGTMNNLTFGDATFGYYETICGGSGATPGAPGADAVHTHMTNTRLTDVEVIERRYPVRVRSFSIRRSSGGTGRQPGGDGIIRELEFLRPLKVSMLSERRGPYAPFGLAGGQSGALGQNRLHRASTGQTEALGGKFAIEVEPGDILTIETPGAGGYGSP